MIEVKVNVTFICEFQSFQQWIDKASMWIGGYYDNEKIICLDKDDKACITGHDFIYASQYDKFPVTAYRIVKSGEKPGYIAPRKDGFGWTARPFHKHTNQKSLTN